MPPGNPPSKGEDWPPLGEGQSVYIKKLTEELIKDLTRCTLVGLWSSLSLSFLIGGVRIPVLFTWLFGGSVG